MLLAVLTVLAQVTLSEAPPEVLIPGNSYREGDIASVPGEPALELCDGALRSTTFRIQPHPKLARFTIAKSKCGSPFLLVRFEKLKPGKIEEATRKGNDLTLGSS